MLGGFVLKSTLEARKWFVINWERSGLEYEK